jgi:hypothetical protein
MHDNGGSSRNFSPWVPDKLEQFKKMYDMSNLSLIVLDEVSMVKPWMLAYLDERLKEATQNFDQPFGGVALVMFGDFDQQLPIGGSSMPRFSMKLLEKEYQRQHRIFFTKQSKRDSVEINSNLCRLGACPFEKAELLRLTEQHRCAKDPESRTHCHSQQNEFWLSNYS